MRKVKRSVLVNGVKHTIWLGIVRKGVKNATLFSVYFYPGDADDPDNKPVSLKGGFRGEKEAIQYGMDYMAEMIGNIMKRNS